MSRKINPKKFSNGRLITGKYKTCPVCNKDFYVSPSYYRVKTCSIKCASFLRKGKPAWNKGVRGLQVPWNKGLRGVVKGWNKGKTAEEDSRIARPWLGKKRSEETKKKIAESRRGKSAGEDNYQWRADRTSLKRYNDDAKDRRSYAYTYWRKEVWLRDNYACKIANPDCAGRIEAHHILGYAEYPELRYQINNGITLCHAHHPRVRSEEKRLTPYFQELVSVSKH